MNQLTTQIGIRQEILLENGVKILKDHGKFIEADRPDGLKVFFDKDFGLDDELAKMTSWLNHVRAVGSKEQVVQATGLVRGYQIAKSYANKHSPETSIPMPQLPAIGG